MVEKLYTIKETLDLLRIGRTTLYRHVQAGMIKPLKLGGKVLFPESELNSLIKKLKRER